MILISPLQHSYVSDVGVVLQAKFNHVSSHFVNTGLKISRRNKVRELTYTYVTVYTVESVILFIQQHTVDMKFVCIPVR